MDQSKSILLEPFLVYHGKTGCLVGRYYGSVPCASVVKFTTPTNCAVLVKVVHQSRVLIVNKASALCGVKGFILE